ncbi:hypothetical protein V6K52_17595 [Knoellia sp. S7-12]|uniref:hypothetical protein n=1 Tax=Knoellia sp. S7-12 TaxID=3126698 RepID=UPI003365DE1B
MGFLDKATAAAKQAATDAKKAAADFQTANPNLMSGNLGGGSSGSAPADRLLRDLGALTYLNAQGRPGSAEEYQRIMGELQGLESSGGLNLTLTSAYAAPGTPPPPPGAVRSAYEASQGSGAGAPPPAPVAPAEPVAAPEPLAPSEPVRKEGVDGAQGTGAPPPPPSWS